MSEKVLFSELSAITSDFSESTVPSFVVYEISTWSKSLSAGFVQLKVIEELSLEYTSFIALMLTFAGGVKSKLSIVICAASSRPSESSAATV